MTVYCDDLGCIHNNDGKCENHFQTGEEAIMLTQNIDGSVSCSDQEWKQEERQEER